jgi:2-polyprenyl-3-methyl-5-hydroxy-6-metoxy-1,4-benzoquinol methylase
MDRVEKLAASLTAENIRILPYLPYLLQDLFELGSIPEDIAHLIEKHIPIDTNFHILDLACGKGAVSIHLAQTFGCKVVGIDLMEAFIKEARYRAREYNVQHLIRFEIGDIIDALEHPGNYDVVIFGSVGDALGNPEETLKIISKPLRPGGWLLIDDCYAKEKPFSSCFLRADWLKAFEKNGCLIIEELPVNLSRLITINRFTQTKIAQRAAELSLTYPEDVKLFEGYVESQQRECNDLEGDSLVGITWLLQKNR